MIKSECYTILSMIKDFLNIDITDKIMEVSKSDEVPSGVIEFISNYYDITTGQFLDDKKFYSILKSKSSLWKDLKSVVNNPTPNLIEMSKVGYSIMTHYCISLLKSDSLVEVPQYITKLDTAIYSKDVSSIKFNLLKWYEEISKC